MNVIMWRGKKNWIGHILRGESLLKEVMEGRMLGKDQGEETTGYAKSWVSERSLVCGIKEKGGKQERKENILNADGRKKLPNGRTL